MNILQINNYGYIRGGSDYYFLSLSNILKENGHQIITMVKDDPRNIVCTPWVVPGFQPEKPKLKDLMNFFYSFDARRIAHQLLENEQPQIAHLHIYYGQLTPSIISVLKSRGIPIVQTLHEYKLICPIVTMTRNGQPCEECCNGSYWKAAINRCNRGSLLRSLVTSAESYTSQMLGAINDIDHFIAVSDFVRDKMLQYGIPEHRISTVHNFINMEEYKPNYSAGDYFLYFGRVERIKGIMTLLAAVKQANVRLIIAGVGGLEQTVEREIKKHKLDVELVGFKSGSELHDLIRGSLCVVVPSEWYETFGLVILEANALGKPVIASRIGGMPEVIKEGETGLLFEAGNVDELTQAMEWIWTHPDEAVDMGKNARRHVEKKFGKERHYKKIMSIYEKLDNR